MTLAGVMAFPSAEEAFDVEEVLFFLFGNDVDTYCRGVLASTLSSSTMAPKTSLVVLVLFICLFGGRLLLPTRCISSKSISRLILPRVFILLLYRPLALETVGINLPLARRWL